MIKIEGTKQELFNKVYLGLKGQGFYQSVTGSGMCKYRGPEGRKCALGHLIDDTEYDPNLEGYTAYVLSIEGRMSTNQLEFLGDLQSIHDTSTVPDIMKDHLNRFAIRECLTIPE